MTTTKLTIVGCIDRQGRASRCPFGSIDSGVFNPLAPVVDAYLEKVAFGKLVVVGHRTWDQFRDLVPRRGFGVALHGRSLHALRQEAAQCRGEIVAIGTSIEDLVRIAETQGLGVVVVGGLHTFKAALPFADELRLVKIEQRLGGLPFPLVPLAGWGSSKTQAVGSLEVTIWPRVGQQTTAEVA